MIRRSLTAKLFLSQVLVILAGSATLTVVAFSVAPGLFRAHVSDALGVVPEDVQQHLDAAFDDSFAIALALAVAAAAITAAAVSLFLSRRIVRPVARLAESAELVAQGHFEERVTVVGSDELSQLAMAFNSMAGSLESAESRRRQLLNDVAHELRTPLATIAGYVEGLADGVVPSSAETWSVLTEESRRLKRLVDDLQKVSRAEERQLELRLTPVAASTLVDGVATAAALAYAEKGVALEVDAPASAGDVRVDADRMAEVLTNLLDNALRHTPTGGRVRLAAAGNGERVELSVEDTGEGIAPEHLDQVFERFYRVDPARTRVGGGSGIGLAIARALVEAHGGTIRAESRGGGQGSRFVVSLPRAARAGR